MASDNFTATNNPLPSPWQTATGMGAMESSGGVAFAATHDVLSVMVYSTSNETSSQCVRAVHAVGYAGPALVDPSTANGYYASFDGGTQVIIVKITAGVYDGDNTVAFTTAVGDTVRMYINGSNQVVVSVNGVDRNTWSDTTYRTGLKPGIRGENEGDQVDDWTDGAAEGGGLELMGQASF